VKRHLLTRIVLVGAGVAAALAPLPRHRVAAVYTAGFYAAWQPLVTRVSNTTPVAWLDVLIVAVALLWTAALVRDLLRHRVMPALGYAALRTAAWAGGCYLLFLATWGLNYRGVALVDTLQFDATAVSAAHALEVAGATVSRLNALYPESRDGPVSPAPVDPLLADAYVRALADLGRPTTFTPGRPKRTLLDAYFRRAGVDGMTDPYFLETLVVSDLLPIERPFVIAHEWGHLAGITDEGEANFVGWLTCLRGAPPHQYSAALFLYAAIARALRPRDRATVAARLASGPRADLTAIAQRARENINPVVASAGWRVYDQYLKANRVEHGTTSYDEIVRLVLGVKMSPAGVPLQRSAR
jgi:hypothetical protein